VELRAGNVVEVLVENPSAVMRVGVVNILLEFLKAKYEDITSEYRVS